MPGLSALFALAARSRSRRSVLKGAALAGATALGAAACAPGRAAPSPTPTAPVDLGSAGAVAAGTAKLYRNDRVLVYSPSQGDYRCFSAVCTHEGCVLETIVKTTAQCACHGSQFDATTGKVIQGPATKPLPAVPVRVEAGKLVAGPAAAPRSTAHGSPGATPSAG